MRFAVLALLALAGCVAAPDVPPAAPLLDQVLPCSFCYEPMVAWDASGRLYVTSADGGLFVKSGAMDFTKMDSPPAPVGGTNFVEQDDSIVASPQGGLWWFSMFQEPGRPADRNLFRIAHSGDAGASWELNSFVPMPTDQSVSIIDRPWLLPVNDTLFAFFSTPSATVEGVATYRDFGRTHESTRFVDVASGRAGPGGPPSMIGDTLVMPFLRLGAITTQPVSSTTYNGRLDAIVSDDRGATWNSVTLSAGLTDGPMGFGIPTSTSSNSSFFVAWRDEAGGAWVAESSNGRIWSPPIRWSMNATGPHPWVVGSSHGLALIRYEHSSEGVRLVAEIRTSPSKPGKLVVLDQLEAISTDFPHAAWSADGRLAVTWISGDDLRVMIIT